MAMCIGTITFGPESLGEPAVWSIPEYAASITVLRDWLLGLLFQPDLSLCRQPLGPDSPPTREGHNHLTATSSRTTIRRNEGKGLEHPLRPWKVMYQVRIVICVKFIVM